MVEEAARERREEKTHHPVSDDVLSDGFAEGVPTLGSAYSNSLLRGSRLNGRGNQPVRIALMRQVQQTYGNRTLRRMLQHPERTRTPAVPVAPQSQYGEGEAGQTGQEAIQTMSASAYGTLHADSDSESLTPTVASAGAPLAIQRVREKRKQKGDVADLPLHFDGPTYTSEPAHAHAGGKRSSAILSPQSLSGMGTDANANLPQAIGTARARYPNCNFKAGHLLNADFFGDGQDADNLTILTASANTSMTAFDNKIKTAVYRLDSLYRAMADRYVDIHAEQYGIEVTITVSDNKWGAGYPDNCIANSVTCVASIVGDFNNFDLSALTASQKRDIERIVPLIANDIAQANARGDIDNRIAGCGS